MGDIKMYGAAWCSDCIRARKVLERHRLDYEYIDIDVIAGASQEAQDLANGRKNIPVIVLPDGRILVEPTDPELESALKSGS
ncbi:MAG: glutaredoxin family protein [Actinomycetota bacterium]